VASLLNQCRPEELGCNACKCLSIIELVLRVRRDFENYVGRSLVDVDNELVYKSLIGGLKDDGTFTENAIANFIRDLLGIVIEDPKAAAAFLKLDIKPKARVVRPRFEDREVTQDVSEKHVLYHALYSLMGDLSAVLKYIIDKLGVECDKLGTGCQDGIEYPKEPNDIVKLFTLCLNNCVARFLPQFRDNACVTIAFHTAQLTRRYLEAVSRSTSHELGGILDRKDLIELFGLQEILDLKGFGLGEEWSLWGYPDCLTYDKERKVSCLNIKKLETLGGAINKAVIINKAILKVLSELNATKWFKIPSTYYDDYIRQILDKTTTEPYVKELLKYQRREYRSGYDSYDSYTWSLITLLKYDKYKEYLNESLWTFEISYFGTRKLKSVEISDSYLEESSGWSDALGGGYSSTIYYIAIDIDSDGIMHIKVKDGMIAKHVKEFLYDVEPLMFLRVLNPIFTGDNRVFLVTSYFNIPMSG
jgi:hypothetical protein